VTIKVVLKTGREHSVLRRHPWIFSGAIDRVEGDPQPGETVEVLSKRGDLLGRGAYSPQSQIRVRLWSFERDVKIDDEFFYRRLKQAWHIRQNLGIPERTNSYRLLSAEADGLPGIIADRYGDYLVCQFLSAGAEYWKKTVVRQLMELFSAKGIYERSDVGVRKKEGLPLVSGVLLGDEPPDLIEIREEDRRFLADLRNGHKTGFYLDQRENRSVVAEYAKDAEVLNCFAYTGGFGIAALKAGAENVVNVEAVAGLLNLIDENIRLNRLDDKRCENIKGDVFQVLRRFGKENRTFDVVVLDPPKFVESQKHLKKASRGYKDINLQALKLIRRGGFLFTFSCSGLIRTELFQKIVADAAVDAGREVQILRWLTQSPDHPVALHIPESLYLKGLLCQVW